MDLSAKTCLTQRIEYNSSVILACQEENDQLRSQLESEDAPIPITLEGKLQLLNGYFRKLLHAHYAYILDKLPSPADCKIHLISRRVGFDETYEWWVLLPSEKTGGVHFKTIVVTNQMSLFHSDHYDKVLVETLKQRGLLTHLVLLGPTV